MEREVERLVIRALTSRNEGNRDPEGGTGLGRFPEATLERNFKGYIYGDGHITLQIDYNPLNCTLKKVNFTLCKFDLNKAVKEKEEV